MALKFEYRLNHEEVSRQDFKEFCNKYQLTHKTGFTIFRFQREIRERIHPDGVYLDACLNNWLALARGQVTPKRAMRHFIKEDFLIHSFDNFEWTKFLMELRKNKREYKRQTHIKTRLLG